MRLFAPALALCGACFSPTIPQGVQCGPNGECPPDQSCMFAGGEPDTCVFDPTGALIDASTAPMADACSSASCGVIDAGFEVLVSFGVKTDYVVGAQLSDVHAVALQTGGAIDLLATTRELTNALRVLPGNGDGTFGAHTVVPNISGLYAVATADVDGDSDQDVVAAMGNGPRLSVFRQRDDAARTFDTPTQHQTSTTQCWDVAVGDIDGDGRVDFAGPGDDDRFDVFVQSTTPGEFPADGTATNATAGGRLVVARIDGDDRLDVIVAGGSEVTTTGAHLFLQDPVTAAAFPSVRPFAAGTRWLDMAVDDLNGDGRADVILLSQTAVAVALQDPDIDGTFGAPAVIAGTGGTAFSLADIDGDERADLAVVGGTSDADSRGIVLLRHSSAPTFVRAGDFEVGRRPVAVAVGDFNGDGKPDLAVANLGTDTVSVTLQE